MLGKLQLTRQGRQVSTCLPGRAGYGVLDYVSDSEDIRRAGQFAVNLKKFREELGWTQGDLADRAKVTVFSISRYEQAGKPGRDERDRVVEAIGRPLADFYMEKPPAADPERIRLAGVRFKLLGPHTPELRAKVEEAVRDTLRRYTQEEAVARDAAKKAAARPKLPPPKPRTLKPK